MSEPTPIEGAMKVTFRLAGRDNAGLPAISSEAYVPAYLPVIGVAPEPAYEGRGDRIGEGVAGRGRRRVNRLFAYGITVVPGAMGNGPRKFPCLSR